MAADRKAEPLLNPNPNASISSIAVSGGLLLTTLIGALQAVVLVAVIGNGYETDAFLAAYSLYYALVIVAASVRAPFVTVLGAIGPKDSLRDESSLLISRAVALSLVIGAALLLVSPISGSLIAHGSGRPGQEIAIYTLLILVPAGVMQVYATSAAAVLNSARRFSLSAGLYGASSLVAIVVSTILLKLIGVLGAPIGLLVGACVLAGGHRFYLRRFDVHATPRVHYLREPATRKLSFDIIANSSLGMAIQLGLAVALAAVGTLGRDGLVTDYSYGYFIVLAMTGFTSIALNTVILPDVVAEASKRGLAGARERIVAVAPFSFGVVVPVIIGLLTFGEPVLNWAAAPLLEPVDIAIVYDIAVIFTIAAAGQILLQNGSTAVISMGRWNLLLLVAVLTLIAQAVAVWLATGSGINAIAWAHSSVVALAAIGLMAALFKAQAAAVILGSLKPVLQLAPCAVGFVALRLVFGSDPSVVEAIASLLASTLLYAILAVAFVPQLKQGFSALLPSRAAAANNQ